MPNAGWFAAHRLPEGPLPSHLVRTDMPPSLGSHPCRICKVRFYGENRPAPSDKLRVCSTCMAVASCRTEGPEVALEDFVNDSNQRSTLTIDRDGAHGLAR